MSVTIWSLNGGRFIGESPEVEGGPLTWLKSLSKAGATVPDILCLQDFRVSLLQYLAPLPHFHFAPMTNHLIWGKRELTGIVIASKYPLNNIAVHYTHGDGIIRDLDGVGDDNQRWGGDRTEEADRRIVETECRVAIAADVCSPDGRYYVATHHGFWVRGGISTPEQLASTDSLCQFVHQEALNRNSLVFIGDCNPDKDGKVLERYRAAEAYDCLPESIQTTVAEHHPAAKFGAKPDRIMQFLKFGSAFGVSDVHLDPSPGSDHLMLCATISPRKML